MSLKKRTNDDAADDVFFDEKAWNDRYSLHPDESIHRTWGGKIRLGSQSPGSVNLDKIAM